MSPLASESMSGNANVAPSWRLAKSLVRPRFLFFTDRRGSLPNKVFFLSRFRLPVLHSPTHTYTHTDTFFCFRSSQIATRGQEKTYFFALSLFHVLSHALLSASFLAELIECRLFFFAAPDFYLEGQLWRHYWPRGVNKSLARYAETIESVPAVGEKFSRGSRDAARFTLCRMRLVTQAFTVFVCGAEREPASRQVLMRSCPY